MEGPGFFTVEFHLRFLPGLLAKKWSEARKPAQPTGFHHAPLELTAAPFLCVFLIAVGAPGAAQRGVLGIILCLLGAGGLVALLVMALIDAAGRPLTYEAFSATVFFFVIVLGISAGIFTGVTHRDNTYSVFGKDNTWVWAGAAAGAVVGYPLGVLAGLLNQKLGFLAFLTVLASGCGMIGLAVTDLVLLFGLR